MGSSVAKGIKKWNYFNVQDHGWQQALPSVPVPSAATLTQPRKAGCCPKTRWGAYFSTLT